MPKKIKMAVKKNQTECSFTMVIKSLIGRYSEMQAILILFNNEFFRLDFPELITREKL